MKWIDESAIPGDPLAYMWLLKEKGIHYRSSGEFMRSPYSFADKKGVWIVFEKQYADAIALLKNRDHRVEYPLTEEEIRDIEKLAKSEFERTAGKLLNRIVLAVLMSVLLGFAYFLYRATQ